MTTMTTASPGSRHGGAGRPCRILVVDDEPALAELLTLALGYEGWDVRSAGDGRSALETAARFAPDAVLLDVMLPDLDGLEVLRRGGETIRLTVAEFEVLHHLMRHAGRDVPARDIAVPLPGDRVPVVALCVAHLTRKLGPRIEAYGTGADLAYRLGAVGS